jgi:hypothetical protein
MFKRFAHTSVIAALMLALAACGGRSAVPAPTAQPAAVPTTSKADLSSIKVYLVGKAAELKAATTKLKATSDQYYDLAKTANFDYGALWKNQKSGLSTSVQEARAAWVVASPLYEQMEGIVAGTPSLGQFDVDLDAGASGAEGGDSVVSFDLALPDGRTLPKPGNLFGLTESTLWGTNDAFRVKDLTVDFNGDGKSKFGDSLPDANVLKGAVDLLDQKAGELHQAAAAWQPTDAEAFGALVANVPTVSDFMDSWKNSRFVQTDPAKGSSDFVAISRLSDIVDNITSWQTIYGGLSPLVVAVDPPGDQQIQQGLRDLKTYIADIYAKEQLGKRYTPEDADLLSAEAQNRATAITGQISQAAATLNIKVEQ